VNKQYDIYARVAQLRPGEWFAQNPQDGRSFILVSKGATFIKFGNEKLTELGVLDELIAESVTFPPDDDICALFMAQNKVGSARGLHSLPLHTFSGDFGKVSFILTV